MVGLDLNRFPSIRRKSPAPVAKGRSTTLDRVPGTESVRRADTGPDSPARFLQVLVESISGLGLASFFPVAEGLPKIIGVDGLANPSNFQSFLEGFHQAMQFFTLPNQPTVRADDDTHRRLRAGALGVRDAGAVRRATPRPIRRFDDFLAMMPPTPATLQAALEAGASDGLPLGFGEALSAFIGATRAAVFANDVGALLNLGQDFGALLAALHQVVNGGGEGAERAVASTMRKVGRNHYLASGHESIRVRKRAHVKAVEVDGEDVPIKDAKIAGSKFVRRRVKKG